MDADHQRVAPGGDVQRGGSASDGKPANDGIRAGIKLNNLVRNPTGYVCAPSVRVPHERPWTVSNFDLFENHIVTSQHDDGTSRFT